MPRLTPRPKAAHPSVTPRAVKSFIRWRRTTAPVALGKAAHQNDARMYRNLHIIGALYRLAPPFGRRSMLSGGIDDILITPNR